MGAVRRTALIGRRGGNVPISQLNGEGRNSCWVLDPNRILRTLMLVIHKKAINQHLKMAYFRGLFSDVEVSEQVLNYILEHPYLVRATLNLVGF